MSIERNETDGLGSYIIGFEGRGESAPLLRLAYIIADDASFAVLKVHGMELDSRVDIRRYLVLYELAVKCIDYIHDQLDAGESLHQIVERIRQTYIAYIVDAN